MSNELEPKPTPNQPVVYQIRLKGHLGSQWIDWFEGLTITLKENGDTLLTGPVVDQAALHGLLKKVRDLGIPLLSVNQVQFNESHPYRSKKEKKMNTYRMNAVMTGSSTSWGRSLGFRVQSLAAKCFPHSPPANRLSVWIYWASLPPIRPSLPGVHFFTS